MSEFAYVFIAAFGVELLKTKFFSPSKLVSQAMAGNNKDQNMFSLLTKSMEGQKQQMQQVVDQRKTEQPTNDLLDERPEFQAVREKMLKIAAMEKESKILEAPETFAQFGKLQRKLVKEQKELQKMEAALPQLPAVVQKQQPELVESNSIPKQTTSTPSIFTTQIYLAILFYLICYVIPLVFGRSFFDAQLLIGTVEPYQMWPIDSWIFSEIIVDGQYRTYISFRVAYILSLKFSSSLLGIIGNVMTDLLSPQEKQKKD